MREISNIIFDLDGTLIDSSEGVVAAVNYSLKQMGEREQSPEAIKPFIGYPLAVMYPHFSDKPLNELYAHFQRKAKDTVVASTVVLNNVDTTLRQLHEMGYKLAIASTKVRPHISGIIEKFNWQDLFDCYTGGNEVKQVKPAPDIFVETLRRMNARPEQTIVVGDTINDIKAAIASALPVVWVRSPYQAPIAEEETGVAADYMIDTLPELHGILNNK